MSKNLLMLNVLLAAIGAGFAVYIVYELVRPPRAAVSARARAGQTVPAGVPAPVQTPPTPGSLGAIASRNLFSPSRSEAPATPSVGSTPAAVVRPTLHGVVLRDGAPLAYLEDPVTKRVAGYRVGDPVAGGTVTTIAADRVVLARPDGSMDVRLHDPTKVRPPVGSQAPGQPSMTGVPGQAAPGLPPVAAPPGAPQPPPGPSQAVQPPPTTPPAPPGRRLPPNLLRRQPIPSDGSNQ